MARAARSVGTIATRSGHGDANLRAHRVQNPDFSVFSVFSVVNAT